MRTDKSVGIELVGPHVHLGDTVGVAVQDPGQSGQVG